MYTLIWIRILLYTKDLHNSAFINIIHAVILFLTGDLFIYFPKGYTRS